MMVICFVFLHCVVSCVCYDNSEKCSTVAFIVSEMVCAKGAMIIFVTLKM